MKKEKIAILLLFVFYLCTITQFTYAQSVIVGFYNFENFYDTIDQKNVADEDFLPQSAKRYNSQLYQIKSAHIASVLYGMGEIENANGLALLGIAEVENKTVLKQLAEEPLIKKYHYQFIHFDSKDIRGIDVALMYHPNHFKPYQYRTYSLTDSFHFTEYATRDILYVKGMLDKTWVHILVNHWPSRRGGERISGDKRRWAATVCKRIIDSIELRDPLSKIIVMGDFNDNPNNRSIRQLKLANPFLPLFKKGLGSLAYRDSWNLFDQILLNNQWKPCPDAPSLTPSRLKWPYYRIQNKALLAPEANESDLKYYKSMIYRNLALTEQEGKYQGYPKRTWQGDQFAGGYSDHYPVVIIFKAKNAENPLK